MTDFRSFLSEDTKEKEKKLKHLEHPEDHLLINGSDGFQHAFNHLKTTHERLKGKKNAVTVKEKMDGSVSLVFGINPDNGKFFVATKSAHNKGDKKLNYDAQDVESNHLDSPELAEKLKAAIELLPNIVHDGVYQSDLMYGEKDKKEDKKNYYFQPNTIEYSVPKDSKHGEKIKDAKLGIAVHTKYEGDKLADMEANHAPDLKDLKQDPSVHVMDTTKTLHGTKYPEEAQRKVESYLEMAAKGFAALDSNAFRIIEPFIKEIKVYANKVSKNKEAFTAEGLLSHLKEKSSKESEKLKTPRGKQVKQIGLDRQNDYVTKNKKAFTDVFRIYKNLQNAKNTIVDVFSQESDFKHRIDGKKTGPEGFVSVIKNRPVKLMKRHAFSKANDKKHNRDTKK